MTASDILWEEPSPSRLKGPDNPLVPEKTMAKYAGFVEELRKHPHRWAVFKRASSPTFSTRLKAAYPGIETTCRNVKSPDGKTRFDIYARWIG